jgi:hypothetical protein
MNTIEIDIIQGDSFEYQIALKNDSDDSAVNLTGASVVAHLRPTASSEIYKAFDISIDDAAAGLIAWEMDAETTAEIPYVLGSSWVYDIKLTYSGGTVQTIARGAANIVQRVTR